MNKFLLILVCALLIPSLTNAGVTGKIAGKVTDQDTGEPLFGVNVIIEGTRMGDATNVDGFYSINNIPPGEYTVIFSAVGYQKKSFVKVKVSVDFTTRLDVKLSSEVFSTDAVIVEAKAPLIRADLTSSQTTIDANQISNLPVESVAQILTLQAGVTQGVGGDIHIRGGRSSEIAYTINGISVANPFDNSATVSIATNAIQELSVISGTFNAEYGNAMSGIVNSITKEGGNRYSGQIAFYTGDHLSSKKDPFFHVDDIDLTSNSVAEFTFGGPVPMAEEYLSFFLSGRVENDRGWLYGVRQHNIWDSAYVNPVNPNDIRIAMSGDNAIVPMNPSRDLSATAKITLKPFPAFKINYDMVYSKSRYKSYSHDFKYNPDGTPTSYERGILNSLEARHAWDHKTYYSVKASYNLHNYSSFLFPLLDASGNPVDFEPGMSLQGLYASPWYQPTEKLSTPLEYLFLFGGTSNGHSYEKSQTYMAKFDFASQVHQSHEIKFGLQVKQHRLDYEDFTVRRDTSVFRVPTILSIETPYHDYYVKEPFEFSAYLQDKMEYESIILNIGLRYDYFAPNSQYSTNILFPTPKDPDIPPNLDKNTLLKDAPGKHQLSPRIGISFPITDKGIIHFSYGHFFQMPPFQFMYTNSAFKFSYAVGRPLYGNANLNPEKTVTYEIGLQQQLMEDLAFNVTGFFKDVRDLLATQVIRVRGDKTYNKYVNKDYGSIKGITFTLTKRRTLQDMLGVTLDYTYQVAEGNDVDADAFFLDLSSGRQSEKVVIFLPWDQTHTLNTTVSVGESNNWNMSFIGKINSGLPYTPQIFEKQVLVRTNSGRRPIRFSVDMFAEKTFDFGSYRISAFLKVFNLFDRLNERIVFLDTGRSDYTLLQTTGGVKAAQALSERLAGVHSPDDYFNRPNYYYAPREVRIGASVEF